MRFFEEPELQITHFAVEDIITASGDTGDIGPVNEDNMLDWA